jgi:AcrR family transcriptional regulator
MKKIEQPSPSAGPASFSVTGSNPGSAGRDLQDPYVQRILLASHELFAEKGIESVNMHAIAKRAGIGQGSLYRRFSDKGEICSALLNDSTERFLSAMEQELLNPECGEAPLVHLQSCISRVVDLIEQYAELLQMMKSEFTGKKQLTQFEHPFFRRLNAIMAELLTRAKDSGDLIDIDPQFGATALIAVISPDLYLYQQKVHGSTKEEIIRGIMTLFVTGLQKR